MTESEWLRQASKLRLMLKVARMGVYYGQPEETKERAYEVLRDAEDALRKHLDNKATLTAPESTDGSPGADQTG